MAPKRSLLLETVVFLTGCSVMIIELVGSHILAPYVGTSTIIWTSLIGVILASLGVGYWLGGALADRRAEPQGLSGILFASALATLWAALANRTVLEWLQGNVEDVRLSAVLAGLILFSPAGLLLGMVSPYAVRLRLTALEESGRTVGLLSALSTVGSIAGTFLTGFFLLGYFGSQTIVLGVAILLVLLSFVTYFAGAFRRRLATLLALALMVPLTQVNAAQEAAKGFVDRDTAYSRVWVVDSRDGRTGRAIRYMLINREHSSAMYLDSEEMVFPYTRFYDLVRHFKPQANRALMLGGAGYSYAKHYLVTHPEGRMTVAEIDPGLTELARDHFRLPVTPRLDVAHQDGRVFLNRAQKGSYDVVFGDAFQSLYSLPFHLTTVEAAQRISDVLVEDGVAIVNLIGSIEGQQSPFIRAEYATFKSVFPHVYLFPVHFPNEPGRLQNVVMVALKKRDEPTFTADDTHLQTYLDRRYKSDVVTNIPVLTDEFAPVDRYTTQVLLAEQ